MSYKPLVAGILMSTALSSQATDNQFVCEFGKPVKISSINIEDPKPLVQDDKIERYTFIIESERPLKASYIKLDDGLKIPLQVVKTDNTYTFIESAHGGNLFVVTIFADKKINRRYHAIWSFHNEKPTDADDFFAQLIRVGRCI